MPERRVANSWGIQRVLARLCLAYPWRFVSRMSHLSQSWADDSLSRCQEAIGYRFRNLDLLRSALTHASGADNRVSSNERLEFLGDAILGSVVCELLYHRFPDYLEGELTRIKSVVVSRRTCRQLSQRLELGEFLLLGKGMITQTRIPQSVLADVFEALVAAIYLDAGTEAVKEFIHRHVGPEIERVENGYHGGNWKSILQQFSQREYGHTPVYQVLDEKGPDHNKSFNVIAQIGSVNYPSAWGRNKKDAEQRAAQNALFEITGERPSDSSKCEPLVVPD